MQKIFFAEEESFIKNNRLTKFDDSKIFWLETLGKGGFGTVEKAYDKLEKIFIAIKKIQISEDITKLNQIILEDDLLKFVEEIRKKKLRHNHYFIKYYGVFSEKNEKAVILKMENGSTTLGNILKAGKTYPCDELLYVLRKLVKGFAKLEENGIANRDVKPDNIILVEKPNEERGYFYKISDFGIGCKLTRGISMVPTSSLCGLTKEYAAPEVQIFLKKSLNEDYNPFLADVYSLGLLALKMINKSWGKANLKEGLLSAKEKFLGY